MYKVKIITVGKIKEKWLEEALAEYEKRLSPIAHITWMLAKDDKQLQTFFEKEDFCLGLDPQGKLLASREFSNQFISSLEKNGAKITFLIGGALGIEDKIKEKCQDIWSLSRLTFTHQITRLILMEQIYRAFEISKGSNYHK